MKTTMLWTLAFTSSAALACRDDDGQVHGRIAALLAPEAAWTADCEAAEAFFGGSVAGAGDVDGDGYDDVIVGAPGFEDPPQAGESHDEDGRAFLYLGSADGPMAEAAWTAETGDLGDWFGKSVASAGDVNDDGFDDVIVGAERFGPGFYGDGGAFLYLGSAEGLGTEAAWSAVPGDRSAAFGYSVACAGDVNGDGFDDVVVGAPRFTNVENEEGRAFLYLGSAEGLSADPAWTAESNQAGTGFGVGVAGAGDVNADGFDDVVVGGDAYDDVELNEGMAFLYLGSPDGLGIEPVWTAQPNNAWARFGSGVDGVGDVNGDGFDDVLVGAGQFDAGQQDEGRAFLYLGSPDGLETEAAWTAESNLENSRFGYSVAGAGDVDGDGFADVVIGAQGFSAFEMYEGRAFLFTGSAEGLGAEPAWTAESNQVEANFGLSVSGAGDVDGDGFDDVIVGAPLYDGDGRAFVYLGACDEGARCASGGLCREGACDEASCRIEDAWYDDGAPHPEDPCRACVPASSQVAWSAGQDGTECDDGDERTSGDACHAGACSGSDGPPEDAGGEVGPDAGASPDDPSEDERTGGCSCRATSEATSGLGPALALLAVTALARRRRRLSPRRG